MEKTVGKKYGATVPLKGITSSVAWPSMLVYLSLAYILGIPRQRLTLLK
jgi:hypothetical protein